MKNGVRERARDSLIPSIMSGDDGGSFGFRREIVVDSAVVFEKDQREMEEE
jgi:hypothetical protein